MADNEKKGSNLTAGIVGAAVGAAVGATAVVLTDKEKRDKVSKSLKEMKQKAETRLNEVREEGNAKLGQLAEDSKTFGRDVSSKTAENMQATKDEASDLVEDLGKKPKI